MEISVLGVRYDLKECSKSDPDFPENCDGYTDTSIKKCFVEEMKEHELGMKKDLNYHKKKVKRHELIHSFLYESGLDICCDWVCEEMVDWLAIQFPKLQKAFEEAGCL